MSFDLPDYNILYGFLQWLAVVAALFGVVLLVSLLTAALGGGQLGVLRSLWAKLTGAPRPDSDRSAWDDVKQAYANIFHSLVSTVKELFSSSPRRIWALAMLTFKESTRRKALLVFVIFALLFMFGGWFLADADQRADLQVKVHVSFVLTAISWLILPVALLLSCWGLPEDIKQRSLHTVVTKPVRRSEIILGRMLGYSCIGTLVLSVMGVVGYIWIDRQVPQSAHDQLTCRVPVYGDLHFLDREGNPGAATNVGDIWTFRGYVEGASRARAVWNFDDISPALMVNSIEEGEPVKRLRLETRFEAFRTHKGDIESEVECEVFFVRNTREQAARALGACPGLGRLTDMLREGDFLGTATVLSEANPTSSQVQQFEAACGAFVDIVTPHLSDGTVGKQVIAAGEACRDAAGDENTETLTASLKELGGLFEQNAEALKRELYDVRVSLPPFEVQEFSLNVRDIDPDAFEMTVVDADGKEAVKQINLFEDVVEEDGRLRVEVACIDPGQYLGAARPDLFIRTPDRPFWVGFSKSIFGIWLMMELIVVLGVTAGALLNGPVSTFLVFALMIVGQGFRDFLEQIVHNEVLGGGVFESIIRIVKHMNPTVKMEEGLLTTIVQGIDTVIIKMLELAVWLIPDFRSYSRLLEYLPNGFDVSWSKALLPSLAVTVGYLVPCILIGYYFLKLRELEQK